ncbi:leucine-rich repeat domain-containing protein [Thioflexithrix psekupsensis]|uniref:Leucine-rich repeat-containing N-terminal plant-type domain-containing protein n=1 Tax=Thioflexithrix psekupsensis TaxID=1570016 RepID=A0A251X3S6_9GAMM|nr:leucine-rich repeat domain-containing protein [Thioflexithrix psekupsensis]OUD12040.1 hypothetical protein TPSD3_12955 [Thioflexithrix psekupsensis]
MNELMRVIKTGTLFLFGAGMVLAAVAEETAPPVEMKAVSNVEQITESAAILSTAKTVFTVGEPITITYQGLPGNAQDWISVVQVGSADDVYSRNWTYTQSATEGEYTVKEPLVPGEYEARLYFDYPKGGMVVQKRHVFRVAEAAPSEPVVDAQAEALATQRAQRMLEIRAQFICNTIGEISKAECLNLFSFYNATQGDQWRHNEGWNRTNRPCQWYGVQCEAGHVVALNLPNNGLTGTLPDLSAFTQLKVLWLSNNKLSGELPAVEKLTNLQKLYLNGNEFSGTVPALNALQQLRALHLYENNFSGAIPELSALSQLETFYGYNNQFSGLMPSLMNLTALQELDLSINQLTGELPDLSVAPNLQYLGVEFNQLSGHFPDLTQSLGLEFLYLGNNQFCGEIPKTLPATHPFLLLNLNANGFYSDDPAVIDFLNEIDPEWTATQVACGEEEKVEEIVEEEADVEPNDDEDSAETQE